MKYWLDTEFIEDGKTIDLISIGIVCEDGREFYAESDGYDPAKASDWVRDNVFPVLQGCPGPHDLDYPCVFKDDSTIAEDILKFCNPDQYGKPEFWGYYADYDWVVFCQLFGTMMDLPTGFPMYCRDLKQLVDDLGNPQLEKPSDEHHALADARWIRDQCMKLTTDWKK